ncbi:gem-associated protein 2-like [Limulus polyphemus]|uniref:Gem-associated protein 2-like n=1 Tax=Limulus polyphemus TaxID=6850 RepID=A0ABM1BRV9_LIMPO|nr:gem-associated protein 2-like [Limulus polyphemus]
MSEDTDDLLQKALPVQDTGEDFNLDIPPTSGNEYLRRVQLEAKQCPSVVVAKIDTTQFSRQQTVKISYGSGLSPAPKGYAPFQHWQKKQVADFSKTRQVGF